MYREVISNEKLVFVNSFSDEEGNTIRAPFSPTWPLEILNILTFEEQDGKTAFAMWGGPINAAEEEQSTYDAMSDNIKLGLAGTFDQLADYLAKV